ncbi:MAG TPA: hypothetical protein VMY06_09675, partial [Sedimentisphaerales bacterium]|nr:hypothetical protein [Sedimentisphaerales bacterium]
FCHFEHSTPTLVISTEAPVLAFVGKHLRNPLSFRPEQCVALRSGEIWFRHIINPTNYHLGHAHFCHFDRNNA